MSSTAHFEANVTQEASTRSTKEDSKEEVVLSNSGRGVAFTAAGGATAAKASLLLDGDDDSDDSSSEDEDDASPTLDEQFIVGNLPPNVSPVSPPISSDQMSGQESAQEQPLAPVVPSLSPKASKPVLTNAANKEEEGLPTTAFPPVAAPMETEPAPKMKKLWKKRLKKQQKANETASQKAERKAKKKAKKEAKRRALEDEETDTLSDLMHDGISTLGASIEDLEEGFSTRGSSGFAPSYYYYYPSPATSVQQQAAPQIPPPQPRSSPPDGGGGQTVSSWGMASVWNETTQGIPTTPGTPYSGAKPPMLVQSDSASAQEEARIKWLLWQEMQARNALNGAGTESDEISSLGRSEGTQSTIQYDKLLMLYGTSSSTTNPHLPHHQTQQTTTSRTSMMHHQQTTTHRSSAPGATNSSLPPSTTNGIGLPSSGMNSSSLPPSTTTRSRASTLNIKNTPPPRAQGPVQLPSRSSSGTPSMTPIPTLMDTNDLLIQYLISQGIDLGTANAMANQFAAAQTQKGRLLVGSALHSSNVAGTAAASTLKHTRQSSVSSLSSINEESDYDDPNIESSGTGGPSTVSEDTIIAMPVASLPPTDSGGSTGPNKATYGSLFRDRSSSKLGIRPALSVSQGARSTAASTAAASASASSAPPTVAGTSSLGGEAGEQRGFLHPPPSFILEQLEAQQGSMQDIHRSYPFWQRASEPGVQQVPGRALGAPPRVERTEQDQSTSPVVQHHVSSVDIVGDDSYESSGDSDSNEDVESGEELSQDPMKNRELVYADGEPISVVTLLSQGPLRRLTILVIVMVFVLILGLSIALTRPGEGNNGGPTGPTATPSPTSSPTLFLPDIVAAAELVSGDAVFVDGSPQNLAVGWMSTFDKMNVVSDQQGFRQRYVMVIVYYALKGDSWTDPARWLDPARHECEWSGDIVCQEEPAGRFVVVGLDANRAVLKGSIPSELALLSELAVLTLTRNELTGTIPSELCGPESGLKKLKRLELAQNALTGPIPANFKGCPNLVDINFESNKLSSTLPDSLYDLRFLEFLELSNNQLSGEIDQARFADLQSLTTFNIQSNGLVGNLPNLTLLPNLTELRMDFNQLNGRIPLPMELLTRKVISVSHNKLTGSLPANFRPNGPFDPSTIKIQYVDVSFNLIEGPIAQGIQLISSLRHLDISSNSLTGTIDTNWPYVNYFAAANNDFFGTLPSAFAHNLLHYDVSGNKFTGGIPDDLFGFTSLQFLQLGDNPGLGGTLEKEKWEKLSSLRSMDLRNCGLNGTLPETLSALSKLEIIQLEENELTGTLPQHWEALRSLKQIDLESNNLSGTIPWQWTELSLLRILDLADNKLTGVVPTMLHDLTKLEVLRLSNNAELTGTITPQLCETTHNISATCGSKIECSCCTNEEGCS